MAADLVSSVLNKIGSVIWQDLEEEAKLVLGVHKQVEDLKTTLDDIQDILRNADEKQVKDKDLKNKLEKLKDIAYDADDVLDEWHTRNELSQLNQVTPPTITEKIMYYLFSPCSSRIPASCSCFIPDDLPQHHRVATEIHGINERLLPPNDLKSIRDRLAPLPTTQSHPRRPDTSSLVIVAEIHGRDVDKNTIVDWLHDDHSSCTSVPVLAIVAFGGFGKTALAQIVFDQEKIRFELAIWVCVSEPFVREKVAKEIIQGATGNMATDSDGWNALHQQLSNSIKGKRFLIVLDDVWSEEPNDWEPFRLSLSSGAQGSRVIVTTRTVITAEILRSRIHELKELKIPECRLLFQQEANFAVRSQKERDTLEEIGNKIADKCKGVPLAVKTIARLMQFKHTKEEWKAVLESDIWELKQGKDGFLPSLFLSYHDLTLDLKQCFLYCAITPKDAIIEEDMLVKLWMAQGFLRSDGVKELETTGKEYFRELARRSFFQDFKEDGKGKIIKCKMHDLVHDFAQKLTENECVILEESKTLPSSVELRHINAVDKDIESLSGFKVKKLRSLIRGRSLPIHSELFCQVSCLRSLDLSGFDLKKLSDEVGKLLHLRYLDLSETPLTELPETMCNLYNLQTLKLNRCHDLCKLPEGTGRLSNLRHLEYKDTILTYFPQGFGKLKHLRILRKFVVSNASGGCKLEELEDLNLICDKLKIMWLSQVENIDEAKRAELQRKEKIVSLTLNFFGEWRRTIRSEDNENNMEKRMEEIIEGLQPHINLEELKIKSYPGLVFPSWMSKMSNVVKLRLFNCQKLKALSGAISKLSSLDCLQLEYIHEWEEEEIHETTIPIMPNLRDLSISGCRKLKVIPNYLFSHNLRELKICKCPELIGMPSLSNLSSLESLSFDGDVGVFSRSLAPIIIESNINHNLKSFKLVCSPHSSLPQGLNHFKSLQELEILMCWLLDFNPEEELSSEHFPNLRKLNITWCNLMTQRCSRVNWSNLSHISEIYVGGTRIRG